MKKLFIAAFVVTLAAMMFWLVGCSKGDSTTAPASGLVDKLGPNWVSPTGPGGTLNPTGGQNGTTLSGPDLTPNCYKRCTWTLSKTMSPAGPYDVCAATPKAVDVSIAATKTCGAVEGVHGFVCVTNGGVEPTVNLTITVTLSAPSGSPIYAGPIPVSTSSNSELVPGEEGCYEYFIPFIPVGSTTYKVEAHITIDNHSGSQIDGFNPKGTFSCTSPEELGGCATLSDIADVGPFASSLSPSLPVGPQCGTFTYNGTMTISKGNSNCDDYTGSNTASLQVSDGGPTITSGVEFNIVSSNCSECQTHGGCTLTQGYWKTHGCAGPQGVPGQYGNNPDNVTPLLGTGISLGNLNVTTCEIAGNVFKGAERNAGNAILRLYSQLLAAKLNLASGSGSCTALTDAITAADAVLSSVDPGDGSGWSGIQPADRSKVLNAASQLDLYNNGLLCPNATHCD